MKISIVKKEEVEIAYVVIDINPRHLDEEDKPVPMLVGDRWLATVNIDTGKVVDWPIGETREYYWKICDAGSYFLLNEEKGVVASIINNYVPNNLLPGEWGDYLDIKINSEGVITNWLKSPTLEDFTDEDD